MHKSFRYPKSIRNPGYRNGNTMVVNQVVVIWIPGLHTYILNCVSFLISSSQFVHGLNVIQINPLWWLWEWVPDCADPIPSWSTTIGMQFLYPGLHYDCTGIAKGLRNHRPMAPPLYRFNLHCNMVYGGPIIFSIALKLLWYGPVSSLQQSV